MKLMKLYVLFLFYVTNEVEDCIFSLYKLEIYITSFVLNEEF